MLSRGGPGDSTSALVYCPNPDDMWSEAAVITMCPIIHTAGIRPAASAPSISPDQRCRHHWRDERRQSGADASQPEGVSQDHSATSLDDADLLLQPKDLPDRDLRPDSFVNHPTNSDSILTLAALLQALGFLALVMVRWKFLELGGNHGQPGHIHLPSYRFIMPVAQSIAWSYAFVLCMVAAFTRHIVRPSRIRRMLIVFAAFTLTNSLLRTRTGYRCFMNQDEALTPQQRNRVVAEFVFAIINTCLCFVFAWVVTATRKGPAVLYEGKIISEEFNSSFLRWITFDWMNGIMWGGYERALELEILPALTDQMRARPMYKIFARTRNSLPHDVKPSILWRIYFTNRRDIWINFVFGVLSSVFSFGMPYFLQHLLNHIAQKEKGKSNEVAYLYVFGILICDVIKSLTFEQNLYYGRRVDVRLRAMLSAEVYAKSLRRKDMTGIIPITTGKGARSDTGMITNLMAIDANRVSAFGASAFFLYTCPLEIIIGVTMLYNVLGVSAFIGLAVMLVAAPAHHLAAKKYAKVQEQLMETRDRRVGLVSEMLQGIRMIKFFAWERNVQKKIMEIRDQELRRFVRLYILNTIFTLLWFGSPILVTVTSFTSYTKFENKELNSSVAFTAMAIFIILRGPLNVLPGMFTDLLEALVSARRIDAFLNEKEIWKYTEAATEKNSERSASSAQSPQPQVQSPSMMPQTPQMPHMPHVVQNTAQQRQPQLIGFENATFRWHTRSSVVGPSMMSLLGDSSNNGAFTLKNISLNFPVGKLSLVCGSTGSGKTSLLMALLREMDLISGKVNLPQPTSRLVSPATGYIPGTVAYVSQYPWLQQASIRENIMFGSPYEADRYRHVLEACALLPDLQIFEHGDQTEIGEKGITLSGGQKQRVALARAIYSRAQFLLFDDCLSAVDAHTARHLFENCLMGPLMTGRTRILVTHHVRLCLRDAAYVALLKEGSLLLSGSPVKLIRSGYLGEILERNGMMEEDKDTSSSSTLAADHGGPMSSTSSATSGSPVMKPAELAKKLVDEEGPPRGKVKFLVYKIYMAACGGAGFWIILTFILSVVRTLGAVEILWLRVWTKYHDEGDLDYYIGIYCFIALMTVFLTIVRMFWQFYGSIRASRSLYEELLVSVVRAPIRFFDTTPVGRIINRFSKDFEVIDGQMIIKMVTMLLLIFGIIATVVLISVVTPGFLIAAAFIATAYFFVGAYYIASSRELKRIESITKSPLYSHFGETLVGISTIRAFGAESRFMEEVLVKLDNNNSPYYYMWMCNRWLSVRVDFMGSMVSFVAGVLILLNIDNVDEGWAGISLGSAMNFMGLIYWLVRIYTEMEMSLNSVERVHEYLVMPQEPPAIIEGSRPPAGWPYDGTVEIKELTMQYAPNLGPVLHEISVSIRPREKIGIVGRTGSGKSTLALSLFRFMEPTSGSIVIDGIDIGSLGLEDLRRRLTIIPQDAVLFNGTIRSNLDPFQEHEDHEIWEALRRVHLVKPVETSTTGYSSPTRQDPNFQNNAGFHHHDPHAHYDNPSYPLDPSLIAPTSKYGNQVYEDPYRPSDVVSSSSRQDYLDYMDHSVDTPLLASVSMMPTDSLLCTPLNDHDHDYVHQHQQHQQQLFEQQQQQCLMMGLIDPFASLDSPVSDGGYNFSQGQRQLLCMARALLRQSKVIIMDEATASVDFATDEKIQTTIRNELGDSTLITVAHRLRTIMDYDRVLVLEHGRVMEFDTPINLITNPSSRFRDMVEKSGDMDTLFEMATRAY
ncbi:hypothetical protein BG004_001533 [Podila humilis]|nr:hypothetical protein BG004_001533 [Podila humilis]